MGQEERFAGRKKRSLEIIEKIKTGGVFREPMTMFFDTEVFIWEGLPDIDALKESRHRAHPPGPWRECISESAFEATPAAFRGGTAGRRPSRLDRDLGGLRLDRPGRYRTGGGVRSRNRVQRRGAGAGPHRRIASRVDWIAGQ